MPKHDEPAPDRIRAATTLGELVRERRKKRGDSLRDLAARLNVSPAHIADIERGRRTPGSELLERLSRDLELDAADLTARIKATDVPYIDKSGLASILANSGRPREQLEEETTFLRKLLEAEEYGWAAERLLMQVGPTRTAAKALIQANVAYKALFDTFEGRDLGPRDASRCLLVGAEWARLLTNAWRNARSLFPAGIDAFIKKIDSDMKKLTEFLARFPEEARQQAAVVPGWQAHPTPDVFPMQPESSPSPSTQGKGN